MKGLEICFCPSSINWIIKHLKKSSIKEFRKRMQGLAIRQHGISKVKPLRKITKRKRKFSPAQLRAQRLFAKRSRAGTLRRR